MCAVIRFQEKYVLEKNMVSYCLFCFCTKTQIFTLSGRLGVLFFDEYTNQNGISVCQIQK